MVPSRKFTVPVGVPVPGETAATVAVNVTDAPDVLGLALEVRVVVVLDWLTTRSPEFWLNLFVLSPAKLATIPPVSVPAVSLCGTPVRVATPLLSVTAVPAKAPSRVKLRTLPARPVPVAELRVAVSVAGAAEDRGAGDVVDGRRGRLSREVMGNVAQLRIHLVDRTVQTEEARRVQDRRIKGGDGGG